MAALSYQFGRYLMIGSSRPGTQPANLQGIWNDNMNPSWDSKYTTNINTEMNYWPVESGNLSECAEPLVQMIKELTDQGTQVAREHYGAQRMGISSEYRYMESGSTHGWAHLGNIYRGWRLALHPFVGTLSIHDG